MSDNEPPTKKKSKKGRRKVPNWVAIMIFIIIGLACGWMVGRFNESFKNNKFFSDAGIDASVSVDASKD